MALSGPRPVRGDQIDAVVSEMFGPEKEDDDFDDLGGDDLDDEEVEEFGRRGGGGGRGGRGGGGRRGGGRGGGRRWGRGFGRPHRWHRRGAWFSPYWWWGYPTYYTVYPSADVDPEDLAEEVADSMFTERR